LNTLRWVSDPQASDPQASDLQGLITDPTNPTFTLIAWLINVACLSRIIHFKVKIKHVSKKLIFVKLIFVELID